MPIYDFTCNLGCGTHEKRVAYDAEEAGCPKCGGPAQRKSVYLTFNITDSGATVPLSDRRYNVSEFKEASQEIAYGHDKAEQEQGRELASPNLYQAGLERARQKGAPIRGTAQAHS